jgi:anti-sigma B factor antagonist
MDFAIGHHLEGEIAVVEVSGWIEISTAPELRDTLIALIDEGRLHLVIDLSATVFLDSTGLGVLVGLLHRLRSRDGSLAIAGARDRVYRTFQVSKLTQVLTLTDTVEDAIVAINVGAASTSEPRPD